MTAHASAYPAGHSRRTILPDLVLSLHPTILELGVANERELSDLDGAVREHLTNPRTVAIGHLLFVAGAASQPDRDKTPDEADLTDPSRAQRAFGELDASDPPGAGSGRLRWFTAVARSGGSARVRVCRRQELGWSCCEWASRLAARWACRLWLCPEQRRLLGVLLRCQRRSMPEVRLGPAREQQGQEAGGEIGDIGARHCDRLRARGIRPGADRRRRRPEHPQRKVRAAVAARGAADRLGV